MNRFLNSVSCLLACLTMACTTEPPAEPESFGEETSELGGEPSCDIECDLTVCRRPGAYGYYVYGYVEGNNCVTYNGIFSVSCDAPDVECGVCWHIC